MRQLTVAIIIGVVATGAVAVPPLADLQVNTTINNLQYNAAVGAQNTAGGGYVVAFNDRNIEMLTGMPLARLYTHGAVGWNPVGPDFAASSVGMIALPPVL